MFSCSGVLADALQTWETAVDLPLEGVLPPLLTAALNDNRVDVVALIRTGADVNVGEVSKGCTPLLVAAHNGNAAVVLTLLRAGADVDKARDDGMTPLVIAAMKGHTAVVMTLLGAGVV
jgi:ankyrin repeat protein